MDIEQFVAQSIGEWRSMRSGHSLAFQQFEDVVSEISIKEFSDDDDQLRELIKASSQPNDSHYISPFSMEWSAESDWEPDDPSEVSSGSCIILPIPNDEQSGKLLRSVGYAESVAAESEYRFLDDGTFILKTHYDQSIAEERIWFISDHVRCRSSVLKTSEGSGILQASFASEVRKISV
ncbi:Phycoerythrobilin lyase CpeS [Synechococcus sp. MIT S9509]|uniref:phycobiliprotein lyase n=1 Tax=unclassified Synechococcus TaxID=2626047 RepID=UPI0007BC58CD|nr:MULTISPECIES: phycobiliprotein lyase [unclassified Synechococcus]KZR86408.1 Phycoerythrobilin lyase CpeS [Synechococcus sp. MIT S9504]KZR93454.1 Phycoerythrobilin lyase CpeS [Synechococcus sp. MIT S9509]